jgi:hypothetical protein
MRRETEKETMASNLTECCWPEINALNADITEGDAPYRGTYGDFLSEQVRLVQLAAIPARRCIPRGQRGALLAACRVVRKAVDERRFRKESELLSWGAL